MGEEDTTSWEEGGGATRFCGSRRCQRVCAVGGGGEGEEATAPKEGGRRWLRERGGRWTAGVAREGWAFYT
jgi:hypothetical protein